MADSKLFTLAEFERLTPKQQGYVYYMEAEYPNSEIKKWECPYVKGTPEYEKYQEGQAMAVQTAQDSEE